MQLGKSSTAIRSAIFILLFQAYGTNQLDEALYPFKRLGNFKERKYIRVHN